MARCQASAGCPAKIPDPPFVSSIVILAVGKVKERGLRDAIDEYVKRNLAYISPSTKWK